MSTRRTTAFESFLIRSSEDLLKYFMSHLSAQEVLTLGRLSKRLRYFRDYYQCEVWDMVLFTSEYVDNPTSFLALMDGVNAMMYGEAVLKFFLRKHTEPFQLDVCTTLTKFYEIRRFLLDDGYRAVRGGSPRRMYTIVEDIIEKAEDRDHSWFLNADRSCDAESHLSYKFSYIKIGPGPSRKLNLHLIRCARDLELRLSLTRIAPTAPLTCHMTFARAVAPFARSTFRDGIAFTLHNKKYLIKTRPGEDFVVKAGQGKIHRFNVAWGPPFQFTKYASAETGRRHLGDKHCWVIPRSSKAPMSSPEAWQGAAFEALDWRMVHDQEGTYMKIGEPFVWSSRYFYALYNSMQVERSRDR